MDPRIAWFAGALLSTMFVTGALLAQSAPPSPAPPGYPYPPYPVPSGYPPPGYPYAVPSGYPPPGYAPYPAPSGYPPPGYYYPPPGYPYSPPAYGPPAPSEPKAAPKQLDDEGQPIPAGYHRDTRARKAGVVAGSIVMGTAYLLSLAVAATSPDSTDRGLAVPYFGPILALLAKPACTPLDTNCVNVKTVLAFDVLSQLTGTALFIYSFAAPRPVFVPDEVGGSAPTRWAVVPTSFGKDGAGLGYVSTF